MPRTDVTDAVTAQGDCRCTHEHGDPGLSAPEVPPTLAAAPSWNAELHSLSLVCPEVPTMPFGTYFSLPLVLLVASCPPEFQAYTDSFSNSCSRRTAFLVVSEKVPEVRLSGSNSLPWTSLGPIHPCGQCDELRSQAWTRGMGSAPLETSWGQRGEAGSLRKIWLLFPEGERNLDRKTTKDQDSISAHSRHRASRSQPLSSRDSKLGPVQCPTRKRKPGWSVPWGCRGWAGDSLSTPTCQLPFVPAANTVHW